MAHFTRSFAPVASRTDHPLYPAIRACTLCPLHQNCTAPVPSIGSPNAAVMLVGESPGFNEDREGIPFTGMAWQDLERYLDLADLSRETVWITNTTKCYKKGIKYEDTDPCFETWFPQEVELVKPRVIVAMGALAIQRVLGEPDATVTEHHGYPEWSDRFNCWVLPTYHPSAGQHNTRLVPALIEDFKTLRRAKLDDIKERPVDAHEGKETYTTLLEIPPVNLLVGADIETDPSGKFWCGSLSPAPGVGIVTFEALGMQEPFEAAEGVIFHNGLYDIPKLMVNGVFVGDGVELHDTFILAHILELDGLGLKALARRLVGMAMKDYRKVVAPAQDQMMKEYLELALESAAAASQAPVWVIETDPKTKFLTTRVKKPQPMKRKIAKALTTPGRDLVKAWKDWAKEGQVEGLVEELGPPEQAYLAHVPRTTAVRYSARDPDATRRIFYPLYQQVKEAGLDRAYQIDMDAMPMVASMVANGLQVDVDHLRRSSKEVGVRIDLKLQECWEIADKMFNPNSTDQVARILFDEIGLEVKGYTKSDEPSTQDEFLRPLAKDHPLPGAVVEYRKLVKLKTSYIDPYISMVGPDGRLHCEYGMVVTGRYMTKNPNLMALPKRSDDAKLLRDAFVARPGYVLAEWDLSQIEMRVLAHVSKDPVMLEAYLNDLDLHTKTAAVMFRIEESLVQKRLHRLPAKVVNFGIPYGLTEMGLMVQLESEAPGLWTIGDVRGFLGAHRNTHPGVYVYQDAQVAMAKRKGYVEDIAGRRRSMPEIRSPFSWVRREAERQSYNFPIQAGALEIMKVAMARLWQKYGPSVVGVRRNRDDVYWLQQAHDALVAEVPEDKIDRIGKEVLEILENSWPLDIPVKSSFHYAKRLGDMED